MKLSKRKIQPLILLRFRGLKAIVMMAKMTAVEIDTVVAKEVVSSCPGASISMKKLTHHQTLLPECHPVGSGRGVIHSKERREEPKRCLKLISPV